MLRWSGSDAFLPGQQLKNPPPYCGVLIRAAAAEDWPAIWSFFARIVVAREAYTYDPQLGVEDARALWMLPPPGHTAVAVDDSGRVLGSTKTGPNYGLHGPAGHVATASFMVDPDSGGAGVGRALGEYVLGWAVAAGYRSMVFNAVVESNVRAVALWRSLGFEVVGTIPEAFDSPTHGLVGLHVMHRAL